MRQIEAASHKTGEEAYKEAEAAFSDAQRELNKQIEKWLNRIPESKREALIGVLSQDPRPGYRRGDSRRFGVEFAGMDVRFTAQNGVLTVREINKK